MDQMQSDIDDAFAASQEAAARFADSVDSEINAINERMDSMSEEMSDNLMSALDKVGMSFEQWSKISNEAIGSVMSATNELGEYIPERLSVAADEAETETGGLMSGIAATMSDPATLMKIGMGLTMLTLPLTQAVSKYQQAMSQYTAAAENAGDTSAQASSQLKQMESQMANLGHNSTDTAGALNQLETGGISVSNAISYMGAIADMAARQHKSLTAAAQDLVKMLAGAPMVARQYGINLSNIADPASSLAKVTTQLATAQKALASAQESVGLASVSEQDRLNKTKTTVTDNISKITTAQKTLADAERSQADAQIKLTEAQATSAADLAKKTSDGAVVQVAANNRITNAQTALTNATSKVEAAQAALSALQAQGTTVTKTVADGTALNAEQALSLKDKQDKLAAAQAKVNALMAQQHALQVQVNSGMTRADIIVSTVTAKLKDQGSSAVDNFTGKLRILSAHIYNDMMPALSKAEPAIAFLGPAFMGAAGAMQVMPALFSGIGSAVGAIGPGLMTMGSMIKGVGLTCIDAVPEVLAFMAPWLPWIAVGAAVIAAGYLIYRNWKTIWKFLSDVTEGAWDEIKSVFDRFKVAIVALTAPISLPIMAMVLLWKNWKTIWGDVVDLVHGTENAFNVAFHAVKDLVTWELIDPMKDLWNVAQTIWNAIMKIIHVVSSQVSTDIKMVQSVIKDLVSGFNSLMGAVNTVAGPIGKVFSTISSVGGGILSHIPGFVEGGTVPGPIGHATLIMAHGGETVAKYGQKSASSGWQGDVHVHVRGSLLGGRDVLNSVRQGLRDVDAYAGDIGQRGLT